jgi:hypothetical protein
MISNPAQAPIEDVFEPTLPKPGIRGFLQDFISGLPRPLTYSFGWILAQIMSGRSMFSQLLIVPVGLLWLELAMTFLKRWTQAQDKRLPEDLIHKIKELNNPSAVCFENPFSHGFRIKGSGFSIRSTAIKHLTTDGLFNHIVRSTNRTKYLKRDFIAGVLICIPIVLSIICYSWLKSMFIETAARFLIATILVSICYLLTVITATINDAQIDEKMVETGIVSKEKLIDLLSQIKKHPNALNLGNPLAIRMASQFKIDKLVQMKGEGN